MIEEKFSSQIKTEGSLKWLEHKGKRILLHSYVSMNQDDLSNSIVANCDAAIETETYDLRILIDAQGSFVDRTVLSTFKEQGKRLKPHIGKLAVVGIEGVQFYFLHLVNKASGTGGRPFADAEKALDWLKKGVQPTATVARLLKKQGIMDKFTTFKEQP